MNKKHTIFSLLTAGSLMVSPVFAYAETNQDKLNSIQSQLQGKQQELQDKQQQKTSLEQEIQSLQHKLDELNAAISKNEQDLNAVKEEIRQTEEEIEKKKQHIAYLQEQIEKREEIIKQRLQAIQEQPRTNLITDVVINAKNIADLLQNLYSVNLILNSDNDILEEQVRDQKTVEAEKQAVESKESDLKKYEDTLQKKQEELAANEEQQKSVLNELHAKLSQTESEIESAEEAQAILQAQRQAVQQAIEAEKRAAAEAASRQAAKRASNPSPLTNAVNSAPPAINAGGFIKPAAGYYSSGFGHREGGMHYGLDIAAGGTVPIVAAADGVVIRSDFSSSYGNVIYISHRINGKTYTTVYAHLSSRSVSNGQTVKQGQQIGFMGNTGQSHGQHLHFELHVGEWTSSKSNAVDPKPYLK
ncbi:MAG: murein hydrolase activator EnvC [Ectobacillus sp.]